MGDIDFAIIIPFALIAIYTPGPANITSTSLGVRYGIRGAANFLYGSGVGFTFTSLMGGLFSNLLLTVIPSMESVMRLVGASYILYLAYKMLKVDYTFSHNEEVNSHEFGFRYGFVIQLLNVKSIIFIITLYTTLLNPLTAYPLLILLSAIILGLVGIGANFLWASLGAVISTLLSQEKIKKTINVLFALLLVYTAIKLSGVFGI